MRATSSAMLYAPSAAGVGKKSQRIDAKHSFHPMTTKTTAAPRSSGADRFVARHVGPNDAETQAMLELLGYETLDALIDAAVPRRIRMAKPLAIHDGRTEYDALRVMR